MTSALDLLSAVAFSRSLSEDLAHAHDQPLPEREPRSLIPDSAINPDLLSMGLAPLDEPDGDQTEDEDMAPPIIPSYSRERVDDHPIPLPNLPPPPVHKLPAFASFLPGPDSLKLIISASSLPPHSSLPPLPIVGPYVSHAYPPLPPMPSTVTKHVPHRVPEDAGIIRCVCSFTSDDGFTIQCDGCNAWLHASCVSILPEEVPEEYLCGICDPLAASKRGVDSKKAEEGQRKRVLEEDSKDDKEKDKQAAWIGAPTSEVTSPAETLPPPPRAKPRRSLTAEESAAVGPPEPEATVEETPSAAAVPSAPIILRDAIGRKRRVGKQPGTGGASTPRPRGLSSAMDGADAFLAPRLASFGSLRGTNNQRERDGSDDEETADERYETWQYEFSPIDKNLWSERALVARLEAVLADLSSGSDSVTSAIMKQLWDRQARARSDATDKDSLLPGIFDSSPISLDSLPPSVSIAVKPLNPPNFNLIPPVAAFYIPPASQALQCPYPRPTVHALYSNVTISAGSFISELRGRVESIESYRSAPINQYSMLGVPKQGVRLLPQPWSLAIDSRSFGNEVRFARSGCHPNAIIRAIHLKSDEPNLNLHARRGSKAFLPWTEQRAAGELGSELVFAIYALVDIGRKEEIILPWDWDDDHIVHSLPSLMNSPPLPPNLDALDLEPLSRKMSAITSTILGTTTCACERKRDCALFWMCRAAGVAASLSKPAASKREPFAAILLSALNGVKDEDKAGRGKKKAKKSDVGVLLGLEREWVRKPQPILVVEEVVESEEDLPMELDVPTPLAIVVGMDIDTPAPSINSKATRPVAEADVDSDGSDLTEPLPHRSDDDSPRKKRKKVKAQDVDEEDDDIVRPPPRRKTLSKKNSSKDVGPSRKKKDEKIRRAETEKGETDGRKVKKVKSVVRGGDRDSKVKIKEKGKDSQTSDGRKRAATFATGSKPSKFDIAESKPPLMRSLSPSDPPNAPARIETSNPFNFGGMPPPPPLLPIPVVESPLELPPPPPPPAPEPEIIRPPSPPRARLSLADYRKQQAQKPSEEVPPAITVVVDALPIPTPSPALIPTPLSTVPPPPFYPSVSPYSNMAPPPLATPVIDTAAALKSIGDYFARDAPSQPSTFRASSVSQPPTPVDTPSMPAPATITAPAPRRESRFSDPHPVVAQSTPVYKSALGLETGAPSSMAAPSREYSRPVTYTSSSSYSSQPTAAHTSDTNSISNSLARPRMSLPNTYSPPLLAATPFRSASYSSSSAVPATIPVDSRPGTITGRPSAPASPKSHIYESLPTGPRSPAGPRAAYGYGRLPSVSTAPSPRSTSTSYSERDRPSSSTRSPVYPQHQSLPDSSRSYRSSAVMSPPPAGPRSFDSRSSGSTVFPSRSHETSSSSRDSSYRSSSQRGNRYDSLSKSSARPYDGVPTGPRQYASTSSSDRGSISNERGSRGGRGRGMIPGWGGRGRGRGRGN